MAYLPAVEIDPKNTATSSVIWLHGLGADGNDFAPLVPHLGLSDNTRFIFPHAPRIPVTINGGMVMPAWYDILEMSIARKVDTPQLEASAAATKALIEREIERGVPADKIIVAGFSQGGAVAYEAALSFPKTLAGLLVLSSYFATRETLVRHDAQQQLPIMVQHGTQDPVVPESLGQQAYQALQEMGYPVQYQHYEMQHQVVPEQIQHIASWLHERLNG
ncbi:MAG: dienelactone hydrolase family protein [Idiomarina sp.]